MTAADFVLLALLGLCVGLALRAVRRGRTGGCGGDCSRCCGGCKKEP